MENRQIQQFKKGSLEMVLLCIIGCGETYGYEILCRLNGTGVLSGAKEGTVYPILYRLEEAGLLGCRLAPDPNARAKKYYSLTEKGRAALAQLLSFWQEYSRCVNDFIDAYTKEAEK